jgi:putative endonuclease
MLHYLKGRKGEEKAAEYLREKGFDILACNFLCPAGEIDIIAGKRDLLVFVEVKCWEVFTAEDLQYAVNGNKQNRIRRAAEHFLVKNVDLRQCRLRFDLIFLSRRMEKLDHWENAF